MRLITALTVILPLAQVQSQTIFGKSDWDLVKEQVVLTHAGNLNVTIPYWTSPPKNLLDRMITDGILENNGSGGLADNGETALARLLGFDVLTANPEVLIKPTSCRADSFGISGNYTDTVCDAVDALKDICTNEEPSCDATKLQNVVSASAVDFLQEFTLDANGDEVVETISPALERKRNLMKTAVCVYRITNNFPGSAGLTYSDCYDYLNFPDDDDLGQRVANYYSAMIYVVPEEFHNPLWTNTARAGAKELDENACFVLGDGYLQLAEETWDAFENAPTDTLHPTKSSHSQNHVAGFRDRTYAKTVVVDTIVHQYTNDEEASPTLFFTDPSEDQFYRDVLHGYFYQKYSDELFPETYEKKMVIDGTNIRSSTYCAIPMGALLASKCGVEASDIHEYMQYYYANGLASQDTFSGDEVCADPALNSKQTCDFVGGSGRDHQCCTWTGSACTSAIGSDVCMTKFCRNFHREHLWRAKRAVTNPDVFTGTKKTKQDCFENVLGLVGTTMFVSTS